MSKIRYELHKTIEGKHNNSVNVVSFSKNGKFLATGCEDGTVVVFSTKKGSEISRYEYDAESPAIDCLFWTSDSEATRESAKDTVKTMAIYAGTRRGKLFRYNDPHKQAGYILNRNLERKRDWLATMSAPVRCMVFDAGHMIVGHGSTVSVLKQITSNDWRTMFDLKQPPFFVPANFQEPNPYPTGIHVPRQNNRVIVTFLDHAVVCYSLGSGDVIWSIAPERRIGRSAVSSDGLLMVATNLYDGIDTYSLAANKQRTGRIAEVIVENVILPICLINDDQDVLVGGSNGTASIVSLESRKTHCTLNHARVNDLIQAIAYTELDGLKYLATGDAEKGDDCCVKIWIGVPPSARRGRFRKWWNIGLQWTTKIVVCIVFAGLWATSGWYVLSWIGARLYYLPMLWYWCISCFTGLSRCIVRVFDEPSVTVVHITHVETAAPVTITSFFQPSELLPVTRTVTVVDARKTDWIDPIVYEGTSHVVNPEEGTSLEEIVIEGEGNGDYVLPPADHLEL